MEEPQYESAESGQAVLSWQVVVWTYGRDDSGKFVAVEGCFPRSVHY